MPPHLFLCLSWQDEPRNMNYTMCGSVHSVSCDDFYMGIKAGSLTTVKLCTTCHADLTEIILCPCIQISYFWIGGLRLFFCFLPLISVFYLFVCLFYSFLKGNALYSYMNKEKQCFENFYFILRYRKYKMWFQAHINT